METTTKPKIRNFTDLNGWQEAHQLALVVYRATERFPRREMFGLTNQMRRCAVSISSNIAEGFSRSTAQDKRHFYTMAQGSVTELQNQLLLARDVGYLTDNGCGEIMGRTIVVNKLLNGLKRIQDTRY